MLIFMPYIRLLLFIVFGCWDVYLLLIFQRGFFILAFRAMRCRWIFIFRFRPSFVYCCHYYYCCWLLSLLLPGSLRWRSFATWLFWCLRRHTLFRCFHGALIISLIAADIDDIDIRHITRCYYATARGSSAEYVADISAGLPPLPADAGCRHIHPPADMLMLLSLLLLVYPLTRHAAARRYYHWLMPAAYNDTPLAIRHYDSRCHAVITRFRQLPPIATLRKTADSYDTHIRLPVHTRHIRSAAAIIIAVVADIADFRRRWPGWHAVVIAVSAMPPATPQPRCRHCRHHATFRRMPPAPTLSPYRSAATCWHCHADTRQATHADIFASWHYFRCMPPLRCRCRCRQLLLAFRYHCPHYCRNVEMPLPAAIATYTPLFSALVMLYSIYSIVIRIYIYIHIHIYEQKI